jgi:hypothetical protein
VADALDQVAPHPRVEGCDEPQPEAAEARRQHGHRDHQAAQSALSRILLHEPAVGDAIGPTDLVDATLLGFQIKSGLEVREQVADRDRLSNDVYPSRRHHRRKPLHEGAQHLEREAARSDHDRGAELDHRYARFAERTPHLVAAAQVRRQIRLFVPQTSEVHDSRNAGCACRAREVLRAQAVLDLEALPARRAHGVDHVVRGAHPFERRPKGFGPKHVAFDDLRVRTDPLRQELGAARKAAHAKPPRL